MVAPKQTDPQFKLRLPADLKASIERAANDNNRSMNAEIVARLQATFEGAMFDKPTFTPRWLVDEIVRELEERMAKPDLKDGQG